jgi:hypothetical protein
MYLYIQLNPFMHFSFDSIQSSQSMRLSCLGMIVIALAAVFFLEMTIDFLNLAQNGGGIVTAGIATAPAATVTVTVTTTATTTSVRTAATICKKVRGNERKSQNGEDRKLLTIFNGLCGGTYLEMGAFDGIRFSNTYLFHKALNWKGLLIEAGPYAFYNLTQNRPNELAVVHAAVCKEGKKTLHYVEPEKKWDGNVGGIWEFATPSFRHRWWKGVT